MPSQIHVFIVDDDIDDQEIFSLILRGADDRIQCEFANDGFHALNKLEKGDFKPSLVFVDINMPKMNGIELLSRLKTNPRLSYIPTYMLSTSAEINIIDQCKKLGANGFIRKRADTDDVRREFEAIIRTLGPAL